jgi:NADH dehydrogenase/NADH:ubiquinone oxidoreductase subunit G
VFCGIGACFDCLVDVGGDRAVRACVVPVREGDEVRTSASTGVTG